MKLDPQQRGIITGYVTWTKLDQNNGKVLYAHFIWMAPKTTTQASRVEILNEGGFRSDGRRQYELRSIGIDLSQQGHADGCATITHGLTQVQVSVFGPREPKMRSHTIHDRRANLNVEVSMAPFSTGDRRKRSRGDKYGLYPPFNFQN